MDEFDSYWNRLSKASRGLPDRRSTTGKAMDEIQNPLSKQLARLSTADNLTKEMNSYNKALKEYVGGSLGITDDVARALGATTAAQSAARAAESATANADPIGYAKSRYNNGYNSGQQSANQHLKSFQFRSIEQLGARIRDSRKAMKLNQQQFADTAGVGRRFVSELENGKESLEFGLVLQCCAAAGIDLFAKPRND